MAGRTEQLLREIRELPRAERLRLVERVVHELGAEEMTAGVKSVIGLFASEPDLIETVCDEAMRARERDPLRLEDG